MQGREEKEKSEVPRSEFAEMDSQDDERQSLLQRKPAPENVIRAVQRNRRGRATNRSSRDSHPRSKARNTSSNSQGKRKGRHYEDLAESRRKHILANYNPIDHDKVIDAVLREPDEKTMKYNHVSSRNEVYQFDRYAPPRLVEGDEFFDKYNAATIPPSIIFSIPCLRENQGKAQKKRNEMCFKALILLVSLISALVMISMINITKLRSLHGKGIPRLSGSLRYQDGVSRPKKSIDDYSEGRVDPVVGEKTDIDHFKQKNRNYLIGEDKTLDVGYNANDDMTFDQSQSSVFHSSRNKAKSTLIVREEDMTDDQVNATELSQNNQTNSSIFT